jgi:hypothetical protein
MHLIILTVVVTEWCVNHDICEILINNGYWNELRQFENPINNDYYNQCQIVSLSLLLRMYLIILTVVVTEWCVNHDICEILINNGYWNTNISVTYSYTQRKKSAHAVFHPRGHNVLFWRRLPSTNRRVQAKRVPYVRRLGGEATGCLQWVARSGHGGEEERS